MKQVLNKIKEILENSDDLTYLKVVKIAQLIEFRQLMSANLTPFVLIVPNYDTEKASDAYDLLENDISVSLYVCLFDRDSTEALMGEGAKRGILDIVNDIKTVLKNNKNLDGLVEMQFPTIESGYIEGLHASGVYAGYDIKVTYRRMLSDDMYHNVQ